MQLLAHHYDVNIIHIFGIAEHGKGEVDHVSGLAKTAIRREIAAGEFFSDASDMVMFLKEKFEGNSTKYFVKEIDEQLLQIVRADNKLKDFISINRSTLFQVILFKLNTAHILAASRLCLCSECKIEYGSCDLFKHYTINVKHLKKATLRSSTVAENTTDNADASIKKAVNDFLVPAYICAIAADDKSTDTVWLVKIIERCEADKQCTDVYGHTVAQGNEYFSGKYLE